MVDPCQPDEEDLTQTGHARHWIMGYISNDGHARHRIVVGLHPEAPGDKRNSLSNRSSRSSRNIRRKSGTEEFRTLPICMVNTPGQDLLAYARDNLRLAEWESFPRVSRQTGRRALAGRTR